MSIPPIPLPIPDLELPGQAAPVRLPTYDTMVIDGSYLLHRVLHAGGSKARESNNGEPAYLEMTTHGGIPTGGVYGCLKVLRAVLGHSLLEIKDVVLVWDGRPRALSERRLSLYPDYKKRDDEELKTLVEKEEKARFLSIYEDQRPRIDQMLRALGIPVINLPRREGDDVVADLAKRVLPGQVLVVSDDRDYMQLVSPYCHVYRAIKDVVVTPDNFFAQTGITEPRRYVIYHAICGDSSDHIEGIQGVGDTTATRIANLVNFTGIVRRGDILEAVEKLKVSDKRNAKRYQLVADHLDIVARNLQLVDLNLEKLNSDEINTVMQEYQRPREFDEKEVVSYFNFYEFRSYLENFANFIQPFRTLRKVITSPA